MEPDDHPAAAEARFRRQVHLGDVAALVRQADRDHLALDTGGGPIARLWATALAGLVDIGYVKATGHSVKIYLPKTATKLPEVEFEWKIPKWSNAIERDRARTYFQAYAAAAAYHFVEQALEELHAGRTKTWTDFKVPDEAIGCGFHEAVRGVLSHHVVIRDGKIANYHPYPPTPWNASPRDIYGTPGPYEDAVQNTPIFEENGPGQVQGHRHHARGAELRSVPARAASTCTWATARCWRRTIRRLFGNARLAR